MKNNLAVTLMLMLFPVIACASELTDSAKNDWLGLVKSTRTSRQSYLSSWWQELGDDTLSGLIDSAFHSNRDLAASRAKLLEARAQLGLTRTDFKPKTNLTSEYANARDSDFETTEDNSYNRYFIGLDSSWEIDFWGRKKNVLEAAKANAQAERAELNSAWVSLSAEVAVNYINMRILQNRMNIAQKDLRAQSEILDILKSKHSTGLIDITAVQQAQHDYDAARAKIPEIQHSINELMNALAILTGRLPGTLDEELSVYHELPDVDTARLVGIPAEALRQRPDILAAERRLYAQTQTKKAAKKSKYPVIRLLGSIGLESFSTGHFFSSGSQTYSIGPSITWPIFNAGKIRKNIQVHSAREEQLLAEYEAVILHAVGEVHDALSANAQEILRNESLMSGLKSDMSSLAIMRDKYSHGLVDYSAVLSSQRAVYSSEDEYTASKGQKLINLVVLFKSLGGGWRPMSGEY